MEEKIFGKQLLTRALQQCEYPPCLANGKSVWADLFIDKFDYLCFAGFEQYLQTIKMSEIIDVVEDQYNILIFSQCEAGIVVLGFFCGDTGVYSLSERIYGRFSIGLLKEEDLNNFKSRDKLLTVVEHIDPDKESDCLNVKSLLKNSGKHTQESEKNIIGIVPHISDQVAKWIVAWEDDGTITKEECFNKIWKLMIDHDINNLEHATDFDIAECYIESFAKYRNNKTERENG